MDLTVAFIGHTVAAQKAARALNPVGDKLFKVTIKGEV